MISTAITPELVRGALELEPTDEGLRPHRLPARARAQAQSMEHADRGQLLMAEAQPSGVRLVLRTRATVVELDTLRTRVGYRGLPLRPDGVYDLHVDGRFVARSSTTGGRTLRLDPETGTADTEPGPPGTVRFDGLPDHDKEVVVWFPHNEITDLLALRTDAPVTVPLPAARSAAEPGTPDRRPPETTTPDPARCRIRCRSGRARSSRWDQGWPW